MKNYFALQIKRAAKQLPSVVIVTLLLFLGLATVLYGVLSSFFGREGNHRYYVALVGDTDDTYLQWGLAAVQSIDDSRFSLEFVEMEEDAAKKALGKGEISAYVVFPEGFMEMAVTGIIEPITYVTAAGAEGITSIFKKEITELVTDIVVYSQKGVYGLQDALVANGTEQDMYTYMTELSLEYAELIFYRDTLYTVKELGVSDNLSTPQYYICAICVLMLMLVGIPFATIYIKSDYAFYRLLCSRGYSPFKQIVCEYLAHGLCLLLQAGIILLVARQIVMRFPGFLGYFPQNIGVRIIPVIIMIAAWNILLFEISENMVSGMIMHFFAVIGLCYVSGCIYPIYALPKVIQKFTMWLPTGLARGHLASCFTRNAAGGSLMGLIAYGIVFLGIAWRVRSRKTARVRG